MLPKQQAFIERLLTIIDSIKLQLNNLRRYMRFDLTY